MLEKGAACESVGYRTRCEAPRQAPLQTSKSCSRRDAVILTCNLLPRRDCDQDFISL